MRQPDDPALLLDMLLAAREARALAAGSTRDLETRALVGWKAPSTTSEDCVLPAGTVLRLDDDAKEPESDVRL